MNGWTRQADPGGPRSRAAARRGWVEEAIMRLSDFAFAFPALLSAIMMAAVFGPGIVVSIAAIGLFYVPVFARIVRATANAVWSREYVLASRAAGKGPLRITFEHVLPNVASPVTRTKPRVPVSA